MRKRILPVLFPAEGAHTSPSPVRDVSSVAAEAGNSQGPLALHEWEAPAGRGEAAPPPEAGSKIVDGAAGDGKVGALVTASPGKPRERESMSKPPSWCCWQRGCKVFFCSIQ